MFNIYCSHRWLKTSKECSWLLIYNLFIPRKYFLMHRKAYHSNNEPLSTQFWAIKIREYIFPQAGRYFLPFILLYIPLLSYWALSFLVVDDSSFSFSILLLLGHFGNWFHYSLRLSSINTVDFHALLNSYSKAENWLAEFSKKQLKNNLGSFLKLKNALGKIPWFQLVSMSCHSCL